jgi:hypothetical protein
MGHEFAGRDLDTAIDAVVHDPLFAPEEPKWRAGIVIDDGAH